MEPPVLHMPNKTGRFHLYSDTSKFVTGSKLYQIQGGKPKLISYPSKRLPEVAKNYSITELELCGLAINIASFAYSLKRVDFDAIVNHLALTHVTAGNITFALLNRYIYSLPLELFKSSSGKSLILTLVPVAKRVLEKRRCLRVKNLYAFSMGILLAKIH